MQGNQNINVTSTVIEKGLDAAKGFLQRLIGPAVDEVGLLLADNIRVWRFKNQINILNKTEEYIKKKGIKIKKVPLKILVPLLEGSSLEEEGNIQEMWVALFVNNVDSKQKGTSTVFPYFLTQISSQEAKWLKDIYSEKQLDWSSLSVTNSEVYNLMRLGLIKEGQREIFPYHMLPQSNDVIFTDIQKRKNLRKILTITELGELFVETCTLK